MVAQGKKIRHAKTSLRASIALARQHRETPEILMAEAASLRDAHWGSVLTYSPKVFLPLTNLCRNICDYCSYRASEGDLNAHTMAPEELVDQLDRAREMGCVEALFCLGDRPESAFKGYRAQLESWGFNNLAFWIGSAF